ncbi:MAG: hypothetical protein RBT51_04705, partial [Ectothiorhodospiraceae bacterium]|nr:hypothetical protein [Ectothiorhodospiraceae bacterium]
TRAAAPSTLAWHTQHDKVNGSCVGCHAGNPRLMRQEMAHKGLVGDPRANPEICASCHKSDLDALVEQYRKIGQ